MTGTESDKSMVFGVSVHDLKCRAFLLFVWWLCDQLAQARFAFVVFVKAFARRAGAIRNNRGKQKELSPQDAALMIQVTFRAYLIRRSKALRALRELAVAKSKLKEIRSLFNNFSYRRRVARDAEERQRFSEKIIVLLLTVDAIEVYLKPCLD